MKLEETGGSGHQCSLQSRSLSFQTRLYIELDHADLVNSLDVVEEARTRFESLVLNVLGRYGYVDHASPVILAVSTSLCGVLGNRH